KGTPISGMHGFILRHDTDDAWSAAAGDLPAGQTFGSMGVYVPIYIDGQKPPVGPFAGTPTAGVTIIKSGSVIAANHYYFSDSDPPSRTTVSPTQPSTGANGTGLFINQPGLDPAMSGMGAEPTGCTWPSDPGAAPTGAVFVNERIPRDCTQ